MDPPWVVVPAVSAKMVSKMKIPESKAQRIPTNKPAMGMTIHSYSVDACPQVCD